MARDVTDAEPVNGRRDLVAWLEAGRKAPEDFKVGSEHEKILFYLADLSPVPYAGERGVGALLEGMRARLGWEAIKDDDNLIGLYDSSGGGAISLEPGGQFELSGAQAGDIHALAAELAAHLEAAPRRRGAAGDRLSRARHEPEMDARRDAQDAEKPLSHHDRLHAEGRDARPRHDVPHRHRAGEPRLRQRSRHGRQTARRPRAAAGDDGSVRQFAVHRRQAQRLPVGALGDLAPHRRGAHRHAAVRLRAGHGLRALRRLRARRADVFRQARRSSITTSPARAFAICSTAGCRSCRASGRRSRIGRTICRRFSPRCG